MARRIVRRSSFGGGRRSSGRLTEWFSKAFAADATTLAASSFVIDTSLSALGLAKRPFTITRTVGELAVYSDNAGVVEHPLVALGAMVVSEKAVATGATAVPDPVTDVVSDEWFLYQTLVGPQTTAIDGAGPMRVQFDSRAQRKVQDGEDIVFVLANPNSVDGLRFWFNFRMLVKLS